MNGHKKNANIIYRPYGITRHTEDGQKVCNAHISSLIKSWATICLNTTCSLLGIDSLSSEQSVVEYRTSLRERHRLVA